MTSETSQPSHLVGECNCSSERPSSMAFNDRCSAARSSTTASTWPGYAVASGDTEGQTSARLLCNCYMQQMGDAR